MKRSTIGSRKGSMLLQQIGKKILPKKVAPKPSSLWNKTTSIHSRKWRDCYMVKPSRDNINHPPLEL
jgi:hypothetical protein